MRCIFMSKLNEKNSKTKKIVHLMITDKCDRNCPYCCNNQYSLDDIEEVTDEELRDAEMIFLTGGEPFQYHSPTIVASFIKSRFGFKKKVMAYTNAFELGVWLAQHYSLYHQLSALDGLTISIKNRYDKVMFEDFICRHPDVLSLESVWIYVFPGFEDLRVTNDKFIVKSREWQKDFKPAPDSIFRKMTSKPISLLRRDRKD